MGCLITFKDITEDPESRTRLHARLGHDGGVRNLSAETREIVERM